MEPETLVQLIGSLGFPIVACIYMAYVNQKQTDAHKSEMTAITEAINDLKLAINTLVERLKN